MIFVSIFLGPFLLKYFTFQEISVRQCLLTSLSKQKAKKIWEIFQIFQIVRSRFIALQKLLVDIGRPRRIQMIFFMDSILITNADASPVFAWRLTQTNNLRKHLVR